VASAALNVDAGDVAFGVDLDGDEDRALEARAARCSGIVAHGPAHDRPIDLDHPRTSESTMVDLRCRRGSGLGDGRHDRTRAALDPVGGPGGRLGEHAAPVSGRFDRGDGEAALYGMHADVFWSDLRSGWRGLFGQRRRRAFGLRGHGLPDGLGFGLEFGLRGDHRLRDRLRGGRQSGELELDGHRRRGDGEASRWQDREHDPGDAVGGDRRRHEGADEPSPARGTLIER